MPPANKYLPPGSGEAVKKLETAFGTELAKRQRAHKNAWKYYSGDHTQPLAKDATKTDDNVVVNLVEQVVDKGVGNLLGNDETGAVKGVTFDIVDQPGEPGFFKNLAARLRPQPAEPSPEQAFLDAVWQANKQNILLADVFLMGAITGHVFLKLRPTGKAASDGSPLPRVHNLNPDNVTVFWAEDDIERVLWYRIQYDTTRQDIVRGVNDNGEDTGAWLLYDYKRDGEKKAWLPVRDPQLWPHAFPPIVDWKNRPNPRGYYGLPDAGQLGRLNDSLNFVLSNTQRILKHHAHPKTIGIGVDGDNLAETAVDGFWSVSGASPSTANIYNLEMQSDLASSLNFATLLWRAIFDLGRELNPGTVADKLGDITNFGLRVLFADSLAKSGMKRLLAGEALVQVCKHLLELGGFTVPERINVVWPDPLPTDPLQTAQALGLMATLGLSGDTALERAGFDPAQEAQRRQLTRGEAVADETLARQNAAAAAVEMLGAAVSGKKTGGDGEE